MITRRGLRYDFALLSNGFQQYAVFYILGFLAMTVSISAFPPNISNPLLVLYPLTFCVASHVGNEKSDKVSDRVVLELGGYKRRLVTRILTTGMSNIVLVSGGFVALEIFRGWHAPISAAFACGALLVAVVYAFAGTIVAAAMPNSFMAVALLIATTLLGGIDPSTNLAMKTLVALPNSSTLQEWLNAALSLALPWSIAAVLLYPVAMGRAHFPSLKLASTSRQVKVKVPNWISKKPSFLNVLTQTGITNPITVGATLVALALFTGTTLLTAAKVAELNVGKEFFFVFPGQIMMSIFPAVSLATSLQTLEQTDQERFFYKSQRQASIAEVIQIALAAWLGAVILTTAISQMLGVALTPFEWFRTLAVELIGIPGLAYFALALRKFIKVPALIGITSFLISFIEVLLNALAPTLKPWLASSLFSAAAGGAGLYVESPDQIAPTWVAVGFVVVVGLGPLVWKFRPRRLVS